MRRFITALTGVLLLLAGPALAPAATLPWKTFGEAAQTSEGVGPAACPPDGEGMRALLVAPDGAPWFYGVIVNPTTGRIRVLFAPLSGDGTPLELGTATLEKDAQVDVIPPLKWQKYEGQLPCDLLYPSEA